jgi:hypothetical protein
VRESKKERAAFEALIAEGKLPQGLEADDRSGDLAIASSREESVTRLFHTLPLSITQR